jgi:hypothetical protein
VDVISVRRHRREHARRAVLHGQRAVQGPTLEKGRRKCNTFQRQ